MSAEVRDNEQFFSAGDPIEVDGILVRSMPPGSLEQVIFRMNALARIESQGTPVINPPRSLEIAIDKYLALARIQDAGLPVPPTRVSQTAEDALAAWESLGRDVVIKPLFGGEGRGLMRVTDPDLAMRAFRTLEQLNAVIYQQAFIQHEGFDIRVMLIGDQAFAVKRSNRSDWRTNLARGGHAESVTLDPRWHEMAIAVADVVAASVIGVDLLPSVSGETYVLEVNAVPGWRGLQKTVSSDIAATVLRHVIQQIKRGGVS